MDLALEHPADDTDPVFETFVRRHADFVYRLCLRLLRHPSDAEDAAQTTFIACLRQGAGAERRGRGWLATVALNACGDWRRSEARRRRHEAEAAVAASVEEIAASDDDAALRGLRRLDEADRALLHLRFVEDLSYREIAEATGRPQKAVETRVRRLVLRLRGRRQSTLLPTAWPRFPARAPERLIRNVLEAHGLSTTRAPRRGLAMAGATIVAVACGLLALAALDAELATHRHRQRAPSVTASSDTPPRPPAMTDEPVAYPGGMIFALGLCGSREAFGELGIDPTGDQRIAPAESASVFRAIEAMTFADAGDGAFDPGEEAAFLRTLDPAATGWLARVRGLFASKQLSLFSSGRAAIPRVMPGWPLFGNAASAGGLIGQRLSLLRERRLDARLNLFTVLSIGGVAGLSPMQSSTTSTKDWAVDRMGVVVAEDTDEPTPLALDIAAKLTKDGERVVLLRRGETYVLPLKPSGVDLAHGGSLPPPCAVHILRAELPPGSIHGPSPRGSG